MSDSDEDTSELDWAEPTPVGSLLDEYVDEQNEAVEEGDISSRRLASIRETFRHMEVCAQTRGWHLVDLPPSVRKKKGRFWDVITLEDVAPILFEFFESWLPGVQPSIAQAQRGRMARDVHGWLRWLCARGFLRSSHAYTQRLLQRAVKVGAQAHRCTLASKELTSFVGVSKLLLEVSGAVADDELPGQQPPAGGGTSNGDSSGTTAAARAVDSTALSRVGVMRVTHVHASSSAAAPTSSSSATPSTTASGADSAPTDAAAAAPARRFFGGARGAAAAGPGGADGGAIGSGQLVLQAFNVFDLSASTHAAGAVPTGGAASAGALSPAGGHGSSTGGFGSALERMVEGSVGAVTVDAPPALCRLLRRGDRIDVTLQRFGGQWRVTRFAQLWADGWSPEDEATYCPPPPLSQRRRAPAAVLSAPGDSATIDVVTAASAPAMGSTDGSANGSGASVASEAAAAPAGPYCEDDSDSLCPSEDEEYADGQPTDGVETAAGADASAHATAGAGAGTHAGKAAVAGDDAGYTASRMGRSHAPPRQAKHVVEEDGWGSSSDDEDEGGGEGAEDGESEAAASIKRASQQRMQLAGNSRSGASNQPHGSGAGARAGSGAGRVAMRPAILGSFASTGLIGQGLGGLPPVAEGEESGDVPDSEELRRRGDGGVEAMAMALQGLGPLPASAAGEPPSVARAAQRGSSRGVHNNDGDVERVAAATPPHSRAPTPSSSSLAAAAGPASPTPLPAALLRAVPPASWEDEADATLGASGSASAASARPSSAGQLPRHSLRAAAAALLPRSGLGASGTPMRAAAHTSGDAAASAPSPLAGDAGTPDAKAARSARGLPSPAATAAAQLARGGVAAATAIQSPVPGPKHANSVAAAAAGASGSSSLTTLPSGRKPRLGIPKPGGTRQAVSDPTDALATLAAAARASGPTGALAVLAGVDGGADGSAKRSADDGSRGAGSAGRSRGSFAAARFGASVADAAAGARRPAAAHSRYDPLPAHAAAAMAASAASSEPATLQSPQAGPSAAGEGLGRAPALPDDPMLLLMMVPGMRELAAAVDRERQR